MKNVLFLWLFLCSVFCNAQQTEKDSIDMDTVYIPKNALYAEFGGNAVLYSLNYERMFLRGKTIQLSIRFGAGYFEKTILSPLMLNTIIGRKKHKLEVDLGITCLWNLDFKRRKRFDELIKNGEQLPARYPVFFSIRPTATFAYRYQSDIGIYYKIGLTLLYKTIMYDLTPTPWGSIGIGYFFGSYKTRFFSNK